MKAYVTWPNIAFGYWLLALFGGGAVVLLADPVRVPPAVLVLLLVAAPVLGVVETWASGRGSDVSGPRRAGLAVLLVAVVLAVLYPVHLLARGLPDLPVPGWAGYALLGTAAVTAVFVLRERHR
ncbi:hypothetical protein JOF53_003569 [Crossiella equi]|uniref:Uncharacterized protein n=1 Tax=Crossiella equi TaxID=130796 RepID=A0ABS5ADN8_9PSEU|nr:hypothetical protein [Crossiella equi]MBP2474697.1 hypothetical protein [Crossiella equi]